MRGFGIALVLVLGACSTSIDVLRSPCGEGPAGTICTIVGLGASGLAMPQDTAIAPDGSLWILDFNHYTVRALDANGVIRTVIGSGDPGDSPVAGEPQCPALEAGLERMPNMAFHDGYLYLAAWQNSRIKRVRLDDMTLENVAGTGETSSYAGDDGLATEAALDLPSSLAFAPNGELVLLDQANQVIRSIDADGRIHRVAGQCVVEWFSGEEAPCDAGDVLQHCPGSEKTTYCDDVETACAQPCSPSFGGDDDAALSLRMSQPFGDAAGPGGRMVYDGDGNLLFVDSGNHRIRKIDPVGIVTTFAGNGEIGAGGDGGQATRAQLDHPVDIAIGDDGTVYVSDVESNCVRAIDRAGIISTVAGQCGARCSGADAGDCYAGEGGPATEARLFHPYGIDVVGKRLYISDSANNRVRIVTL